LHPRGDDAANAALTRARLLAAGWEILPLPSDLIELGSLVSRQHPVVQRAVRAILSEGYATAYVVRG
jgi:hypothetical protein